MAKLSLSFEGCGFHFCGALCLEKFRAEPSRYVGERREPPTSAVKQDGGAAYVCPMHAEVRQDHAGPCSKCGVALEAEPTTLASKAEYVCPMHPEMVRHAPGACPICGMALEPRAVTAGEPANPELVEMSRRFWWSIAPTVVVVVLAMSGLGGRMGHWFELALATPVVLWGGFPFFRRGAASVAHGSLNMFTLIALGTGAAYVYSLVAALAPGIFPPSFHESNGTVGVYFEAAATITVLVLLGQVLELRARSRTGSAIRSMLGLAPKSGNDPSEARGFDHAERGRSARGRPFGPRSRGGVET